MLTQEDIVRNQINAAQADVKKLTQPADASIANEIDSLFKIQLQRADFMRQGILGDTAKFGVGGQYYDQFYEKYNALKKAHNL